MSARDKDPALNAGPLATHTPFSWFYPGVKVDKHAAFVGRTNNVLRGIVVIMDVIQSNRIDMETDGVTHFNAAEIEDLALLATESAKMLQEVSAAEIARINAGEKGSAA